MPVDVHADAIEQGEPDIAERRVFRKHNVLSQFDAGPATGEHCGAVVEVMDRANVAADWTASRFWDAAMRSPGE